MGGGFRRFMFSMAGFCLLLIILYASHLLKRGSYFKNWKEIGQLAEFPDEREKQLLPTRTSPGTKFLSYQPPGNGWNNQRIAIETALVLARLLNRTLIVHPLSSHRASENMKSKLPPNKHFGYLTYNKMVLSNLLQISRVLDLELMSKVVPVVEVNMTHTKFLKDYSYLTRRTICHGMGQGYWVDRRPRTPEEKLHISRQAFVPNESWKAKCSRKEEQRNKEKLTIRYISDLFNDTSELIYFSEGTLFGVQIRFVGLELARMAQEWITGHVRYNRLLLDLAKSVGDSLGTYNAIHVRRVGHQTRHLTPGSWVIEMMNKGFSNNLLVYVSTDEPNLEWFAPIQEAGFNLVFATNFSNRLDLSGYPRRLRKDLLGICEQIICVRAKTFVPSPHSTFSSYILRERGEIEKKDGLYMNVLHTAWIKHTIT